MAAVWGTEFIQFLAALAILLQNDLKNRMNSSFFSYHPGAIHPFLYIILVQNSQRGKELNLFRPPNSSDDLLPSLLYKSLLYGEGGGGNSCVYRLNPSPVAVTITRQTTPIYSTYSALEHNVRSFITSSARARANTHVM